MKKSFLLFIGFIFSTSSVFADWGDKQDEVDAVVNAGQPQIEYNSATCSNKGLKDLLVYTPFANYPGECVSVKPMPKRAISELLEMEEDQLLNDSDYDTRITKAYVMEHNGAFSVKNGITERSIKYMKLALNIPEETNMYIELMAPLNRPFDMLNYYLTFGSAGFEFEDTYLGQHMNGVLKDEMGMHLMFTESVELYPGGGINAAYHVFVMDKKLVYVKAVIWNS